MKTFSHRRQHWALKKRSPLAKLLLSPTSAHPEATPHSLWSAQVKRLIAATLNFVGLPYRAMLTLSLVSKKEIQALNKEFRQKELPTNILSFPAEPISSASSNFQPFYLGELILCPEVVAEEAQSYALSFSHRLHHLLVHGTLHLLHYDHEEEKERLKMEQLEISILKLFNISNPYLTA